MPKNKCPHCGTKVGDGEFSETVAYDVRLVPVTTGPIVYIREGADEPIDYDFGEDRFFCHTCEKNFRDFVEEV